MQVIIRMVLAAVLSAMAWSVQAVEPIQGNSGEYMSPYTSDGVVADWVDKAINANIGSAVGGAVGAYAGAKAMENVPFVGGFLGNKAGKAMGRQAAIKASGGEGYMRRTSDLSFHSLNDMARWMYLEHGQSGNYSEVLKATQEVYPELKQIYPSAVASVNRQGGQSGAQSVAASQQSAPAPSRPAYTPPPAAPPKPYTERDGGGGIALLLNRGDIDGTGLAMGLGVNTARARSLGVFYNLGMTFSSAESDSWDDEGTDVFELFMGVGPSWGFSENVRGYASIQMDMISYDTPVETLDFFGFGYRLGAEFRMPANNLVLDLGVRSVNAEDEYVDGVTAELDYTGMKADLEYAFSDGAAFWLGYEDRDEDNSSIYIGIRGRF